MENAALVTAVAQALEGLCVSMKDVVDLCRQLQHDLTTPAPAPPMRATDEQVTEALADVEDLNLLNAVETTARHCITEALARTQGQHAQAAALLCITPQTLRYYLEKYDLAAPGKLPATEPPAPEPFPMPDLGQWTTRPQPKPHAPPRARTRRDKDEGGDRAHATEIVWRVPLADGRTLVCGIGPARDEAVEVRVWYAGEKGVLRAQVVPNRETALAIAERLRQRIDRGSARGEGGDQ